MKFKKLRSVKLPYAKQGQIYFTLLNYSAQPERVRQRIDKLIRTAAAEDPNAERALRELLIKGESGETVSVEYHIGTPTLCRMRKWVYEHW